MGKRVPGVVYLRDLKDQMVKDFREGLQMGKTTCWPVLDNYFTLHKGHTIVIGGMGNMGKSEFLKQMVAARAIFHNERWAFFSPEENPPTYFYNAIIHAIVGKPVQKRYESVRMSEEEYVSWVERLESKILYVFPDESGTAILDQAKINSTFQEIINEHGLDGCVTDPFNQLIRDWNKHGRDDAYVVAYGTEEKRFALRNNVYKITVVHPNSKPGTNDEGDFLEPNYQQLAGGASWPAVMDDILIFHQPHRVSNPRDSLRTIQSVKLKKKVITGDYGTAEFYYDWMTGRYFTYEDGKSHSPFGPVETQEEPDL